MRHPSFKNVLSVLFAATVVACAQLQGLDGYEKVDCLDNCDDAATTTPPPPDGPEAGLDSAVADVAPKCPPCGGTTPVCDEKAGKCVECLPGVRDCKAGYFCDPDEALGHKCVLGCGTVSDCYAALDGGSGDASTADGGLGTLACCNSRCVDLSTDGRHCGACGNSCGAFGACCASTCLDITATPTSCGGCGLVCSNSHLTTPTCGAKKCNGTCDDGWADCNADKLSDGCEANVFDDPTRCGACNKSCSNNHVPTPSCSTGSCNGTCESGYADCNNNKLLDGCESNIASSPATCGGCGLVCSNNHVPAPACANGGCNGACEAGWSDCNANKLLDGCEQNIATNADNCGSCGTACSSSNMQTRTCSGGVCNGACATGFGDCNADKRTDGCETDVSSNPDKCGACNTVCSSVHVTSRTCATSKCNGTCDSGFADCNNDKAADGCETKVGNDTNNCSACGVACPAGTRRCSGGTCSAGYGVTSSPQPFIDACTQVGATKPPYPNGAAPAPPVADDAWTNLLSLPFTFTAYGTAYTKYWVTTNGNVGLGNAGTTLFDKWNSCAFPEAGVTTTFLYAYNGDLEARAADSICVATTGAVGSRKHIITWNDFRFFPSSADSLTFSAILNEGTNTIDVVYKTLSGGGPVTGGTSRIGLQGPASQFTRYSCNEPHVAQGSGLRYIP